MVPTPLTQPPRTSLPVPVDTAPSFGYRPAWAVAAELRRREAAADARLAAAWARLAEALAELERARAAELQRRLEETYGKRRRLKRVAAAARDRIHETRARLQEREQQ
ncbi:hypothetical protein ACQ4PT_041389 [Festuca glaucescens]